MTSVQHVFMLSFIRDCIPPIFSPLCSCPQLQAPTVKGFDFAKLHLGQHSKDDIMVIQEAAPPGPGSGPLPVSNKDGLSPLANEELSAPVSKNSAPSTKASRSSRRHERWNETVQITHAPFLFTSGFSKRWRVILFMCVFYWQDLAVGGWLGGEWPLQWAGTDQRELERTRHAQRRQEHPKGPHQCFEW